MAGRRGGIKDFMDGFNSVYGAVRGVQKNNEMDDIMAEKPTDVGPQYNADQQKQIAADAASGKLNENNSAEYFAVMKPEGLGGSVYNGKTYDTPITDTQLDGLRAARLADVAAKYGDPMGAMALRAQSRQAEFENDKLNKQHAVDAVTKDFADKTKNMSDQDWIDAGIKQYNSNQGISGVGGRSAMSINPMPNADGTYNILKDDGKSTQIDRTATPAELVDAAKQHLFENHVLNLAAADPEKYLGNALTVAQNNKHMQLELAKMAQSDKHFARQMDEEERKNRKGEDLKKEEIGLKRTEIGNTAAYQKGVLGHFTAADTLARDQFNLQRDLLPSVPEVAQATSIQKAWDEESAKGDKADPKVLRGYENQMQMLRNSIGARTGKGAFTLGQSNHNITDEQKMLVTPLQAKLAETMAATPHKSFFNGIIPWSTEYDDNQAKIKGLNEAIGVALKPSVSQTAQGKAYGPNAVPQGPGSGDKGTKDNAQGGGASVEAPPPSLAQARQAVAQDAFMKSYDPYGYGAQAAGEGKTGLGAAYNYFLDPMFTRWGSEWDRIKHTPR